MNWVILIFNLNLGSLEPPETATSVISTWGRHQPGSTLWASSRLSYRASSCSGTRTRTQEALWRSPQLSSPPARTTACRWQRWTVGEGGGHGRKTGRTWVWNHTYPQAEVQQEEDVEAHVDLQREVCIEVLAGLDGTIRGGEMKVKSFQMLSDERTFGYLSLDDEIKHKSYILLLLKMQH